MVTKMALRSASRATPTPGSSPSSPETRFKHRLVSRPLFRVTAPGLRGVLRVAHAAAFWGAPGGDGSSLPHADPRRGRGGAEHSLPRSLPRSLPVHFRVHFRDGASCHRTAVLGAASSLLGPPLGDMGFLTAWQLGPKRGQLGRTGRKLLRTAQPLRPPSAPSAVVTRLPDSRRGPQRTRLPAGSLSVILRGERVETSRPRRPRAHLPDARHTPMKPSPCPAPPPSPSRSLTSATVFQALQVMSSPVELHSPALSLTEQVNESFLTGERILNQVREICLIFLFFLTTSF